jgi:hypothetical protein
VSFTSCGNDFQKNRALFLLTPNSQPHTHQDIVINKTLAPNPEKEGEKTRARAADRIQVIDVEVGEQVDGVGPFVGGGSLGRGLRGESSEAGR